jgi:hypothetical protein
LVGSDEATFVIEGAFGATKTTGLVVFATSQVPVLFLTNILYVPADKPLNTFETCQFVPPSIEYSAVELPAVAVTVIVPLSVPHSVGSVDATLIAEGAVGAPIIAAPSDTIQVPSTFLLNL